MSSLLTLWRRRGVSIDYLLRDEFNDAVVVGSVDGTDATPGPGVRNVVDLDSLISIGTGVLSTAAGGSSGWNRTGLWYAPVITRDPGLVVAQSYNWSSFSTMSFGLTTVADANFSGYNNVGLANAVGPQLVARRTLSGNSPELIDISTGTDYRLYQVLRASGRFIFAKTGSDTKMIWLDEWNSTASLYMGFTRFISTCAFTIDDVIGISTPLYSVLATSSDSFDRADGAPGNTDGAGHQEANSGSGLAWASDSGTPAISSNTLVFSALSGGLGIATVDTGNTDEFALVETTRSAGDAGVVLRYVDNNNYIIVYHDGTNVKADKVVGGVTTNVISVAVAYGAGQLVSAKMDDTELRVFYNESYVDHVTVADAGLQTGTKTGVYTTDTGASFDNWRTFRVDGYSDLGNY